MTARETVKLDQYSNLIFRRCEIDYNGSGIYLIQFKDGSLKVGMSSCIRTRLKTYNTPWVKPVLRIQCYSHPNPRSIETVIKKHYSKYTSKNSPEYFFGLSFDKVLKFIEQVHRYKEAKEQLVSNVVETTISKDTRMKIIDPGLIMRYLITKTIYGWDKEFISNVSYCRTSGYNLTEKQLVKLTDLYYKYKKLEDHVLDLDTI